MGADQPATAASRRSPLHDPIVAAVAEALHRSWCATTPCGYGVDDYEVAARAVAEIRNVMAHDHVR